MAHTKLDPKIYVAVQKAVRALIGQHGDRQVFAALRRYINTTRQERRLESEIRTRAKELLALRAKARRR